MTSAAEAAEEEAYIIGQGTASCTTWTEFRRHGQGVSLEQWILGYLSGAGVWSESYNPPRGTDANAVWAWVGNYCRAQPLLLLMNAGLAFVVVHPR
jgi:hypothetical protein